MSIKTHTKLTTLPLLLYSTFAFSDCEIQKLSLEAISEQIRYNIASSSQFSVSNSYRVKADFSGQECLATVSIALDNGEKSLLSNNNDQLDFEWHGNGQLVGNQWKVQLTDQQPSKTFQLRYPSLQWKPAGTYQGKLEVALIGSHSSHSLPPKSIPITMNVLPIAKIQFYGIAQNHYNLDLGELSSYKLVNSAPKLWVQTNSGYSIAVSSDNQGKLRHQTEESRWDIDYSMNIDQHRLDLRQTVSEISRNEPTQGSPMNIQFEIGDTNNKPGGRYKDTIQISIEPTLTYQH